MSSTPGTTAGSSMGGRRSRQTVETSKSALLWPSPQHQTRSYFYCALTSNTADVGGAACGAGRRGVGAEEAAGTLIF